MSNQFISAEFFVSMLWRGSTVNRHITIVGLFMIAGVAGAEEPAATPYRPMVSHPAVLPMPGMPEIELGGQRSSGGPDKRRDGVQILATLLMPIGACWSAAIFMPMPFR